jgi:hypothetical protein
MALCFGGCWRGARRKPLMPANSKPIDGGAPSRSFSSRSRPSVAVGGHSDPRRWRCTTEPRPAGSDGSSPTISWNSSRPSIASASNPHCSSRSSGRMGARATCCTWRWRPRDRPLGLEALTAELGRQLLQLQRLVEGRSAVVLTGPSPAPPARWWPTPSPRPARTRWGRSTPATGTTSTAGCDPRLLADHAAGMAPGTPTSSDSDVGRPDALVGRMRSSNRTRHTKCPVNPISTTRRLGTRPKTWRMPLSLGGRVPSPTVTRRSADGVLWRKAACRPNV